MAVGRSITAKEKAKVKAAAHGEELLDEVVSCRCSMVVETMMVAEVAPAVEAAPLAEAGEVVELRAPLAAMAAVPAALSLHGLSLQIL